MHSSKIVSILPPGAAVNGSSFTTQVLDTMSYGWATIVFHFGDSDVGITSLQLQQSDSAGSGFTEITGLTIGTSENTDDTKSALPSATDDDGFVIFEIRLVPTMPRYLRLVATAGSGTTGAYASAFAILSRPTNESYSISDRGCLEILRV